jgi:hypothetical protein
MGPEASRPDFQAHARLKDLVGRMSGSVEITDHGLALGSTIELW